MNKNVYTETADIVMHDVNDEHGIDAYFADEMGKPWDQKYGPFRVVSGDNISFVCKVQAYDFNNVTWSMIPSFSEYESEIRDQK